MNNNNNNDYSKKCAEFADILNSLTPLEFTLLASLLGYSIALNTTPDEQNALGNWFELVGQILITFSAKVPNPSISDIDALKDEIEMLKAEINRLKH